LYYLSPITSIISASAPKLALASGNIADEDFMWQAHSSSLCGPSFPCTAFHTGISHLPIARRRPPFPFPCSPPRPAPARSQAERKEDERIQEFLRAVYDLEAEKAEVDKHFNDNYKLFVKLWKGIISEKKELNSQLKALDSARSSLRDKTKKVSRAEQKEPQYADFGVRL